jgi:hypothetical protein
MATSGMPVIADCQLPIADVNSFGNRQLAIGDS